MCVGKGLRCLGQCYRIELKLAVMAQKIRCVRCCCRCSSRSDFARKGRAFARQARYARQAGRLLCNRCSRPPENSLDFAKIVKSAPASSVWRSSSGYRSAICRQILKTLQGCVPAGRRRRPGVHYPWLPARRGKTRGIPHRSAPCLQAPCPGPVNKFSLAQGTKLLKHFIKIMGA